VGASIGTLEVTCHKPKKKKRKVRQSVETAIYGTKQ
jgi:hypothetical protein